MRLAVVASHPVQYQAPWFRGLAQGLDLTVFFCHRQDAEGQASAGYGTAFEWDVPLLDGYRSSWLVNVSASPGVGAFSGCDTPGVRERLEAGQFDACIVLGWYLKSYLQAIRACRALSIPVLLRGDSTLTTARASGVRMLKYLPYRLLLGSVAGHLVVGRRNREYLKHYGVGERQLFDVPHAVDDRWFARRAATARHEGARQRLRASLGIPDDARVALFVGRLVESKRPLDFIRAVSDRRTPPDTWGLVVGSGPLEDEARALARQLDGRVVFAGFQNQQALPAWYVAADWLVLPSDGRETWGLVANEALACGLPVVVSDAAGCSADLAVGAAGRRFPVGDVGQIVDAMCAVRESLLTDSKRVHAAVNQRSTAFGCDRAVTATILAVRAVARQPTVSLVPPPGQPLGSDVKAP